MLDTGLVGDFSVKLVFVRSFELYYLYDKMNFILVYGWYSCGRRLDAH